MKWSYGVTTHPSRKDTLLPRTLASLEGAGFTRPRLFVDGATDPYEYVNLFGYTADNVTVRGTPLRVAGNWILSLYELYIRTPDADRFAVFQDDFVTYRGLRDYLTRCAYPAKGYWNLYTFPSNQMLCPRDVKSGAAAYQGWYLSSQMGRGAVALVFDRETVMTLLSQRHLVRRVQDPHRGHRAIDGGVVEALKQEGWSEYVHNPSLVQHTGLVSSMGNHPHLQATSFRGEDYNALDILGARCSG